MPRDGLEENALPVRGKCRTEIIQRISGQNRALPALYWCHCHLGIAAEMKVENQVSTICRESRRSRTVGGGDEVVTTIDEGDDT